MLKDKKETRKIILYKRKELLAPERERLNSLIFRNVISHERYKEATHVLAFITYNDEVDTRGLILHALSHRKKVYAPVVDAETKKMDFYSFSGNYELSPGAYGILEPPAIKERMFTGIREDIKCLMLMPGAAFDKGGNRLGYGAGYYDRYLSALKEGMTGGSLYTLAPAFSFQLIDRVPVEPHDLTVDCIITEKGVVQIRG